MIYSGYFERAYLFKYVRELTGLLWLSQTYFFSITTVFWLFAQLALYFGMHGIMLCGLLAAIVWSRFIVIVL